VPQQQWEQWRRYRFGRRSEQRGVALLSSESPNLPGKGQMQVHQARKLADLDRNRSVQPHGAMMPRLWFYAACHNSIHVGRHYKTVLPSVAPM
jgi:hypothetical protein